LWSKFLDRVTDKNKDLQAYLARVSGYALTGITNEHQMWFLFGSGRNGKGVFMNTVANILGDYHRTAAIETFTVTNTEAHPTELAMLRGARLVTATETEEGRRWAESRLKTITGGDKISARFMRQDFFEFYPQFKLIISGNHKPGLRSVDEAIRARINLVPFSVLIPKDKRDPHLTEKLKAEWPGILAWMIKGCKEWQRNDLSAPSVVTNATAEYLDNEDTVSQWIDDKCDVDKQHWAPFTKLFKSWKEWADNHGEFVISVRRFRERLDAMGHTSVKVKEVRGRQGLRLKPLPGFRQEVHRKKL
jgi:putative DNA primase/helicase